MAETLSIAPSTRSRRGSRRRCLPRRHVSSARGSADLLDEVADFAAIIGYGVGDWQRTPLRDWSRIDSRGKWVHRRCGLSVPRQAGKSHDAIIWAAFLVLEMGYSVLWTDHNYSTTCEMLARFRKIFGRRVGDPDAHRAINRRVSDAKSKTAQESYEFSNGGVLCFSTRTDSASLGYSFDVIIYDEAQLLTKSQAQTLNPTTTHAPHKNSQLVYVGTPTRAGCPADRFKELREEAWGDSPGDDMCWLEYGVDEVGDPLDESRWYAANPSLAEGLVEVEDVRTGVMGMKGDDLAIAQEYLGYWLPPQEQAERPLIGEELWRETLIDDADVPGEFSKVAYGVKFSADGSTVSVAVAATSGGKVHVELPFCESTARGTRWLVGWLAVRAGRACAAVIDGKSGAGTLCDRLREMGVPGSYVMRPTADQAITAANLVYEAAGTDGLTHVACPALDLSAATATRREIGKGGGWGFGGENSTPIEAAGLAMLGLAASRRNPKRKAKVT